MNRSTDDPSVVEQGESPHAELHRLRRERLEWHQERESLRAWLASLEEENAKLLGRIGEIESGRDERTGDGGGDHEAEPGAEALHRLVAMAPVPLVVFDEDGGVRFLNAPARLLLGNRPPLRLLCAPDGKPILERRRVTLVREGREVVVDTRGIVIHWAGGPASVVFLIPARGRTPENAAGARLLSDDEATRLRAALDHVDPGCVPVVGRPLRRPLQRLLSIIDTVYEARPSADQRESLSILELSAELLLHVFEDQTTGAAESPPSIAETGEAGRVLVVDDNPFACEILVRWLRQMGYAVDTAESGDAAVESAARRSYDAILMDVVMPGMDGLTAMERIRENGSNRRTPVVTISGEAQVGGRARCLAAGANEHLSKPVMLADLKSVLEICVRR